MHDVGEKGGPEDTDNSVIEIFKKIGVNIKKKDIDRSHRLGLKKKDNPREKRDRKRPSIESFISYKHKKEVYDTKKNW